MLPHIPSAALRLALLGFLCNLKPSEPYLSLYLTDGKRLSTDALASEVYPWSTFGGFVFLLPFALLSEVVGCRPVILLGLLCREATRVLLIYGEGVRTMAAMQLCYAASHASMSVYFAYVYCVATPEQYALFTAVVMAAYHGGNVAGSLLAELCVRVLFPAWIDDLTPLFYLSLGTSTLGLLAFAALPRPLRAPPVSLASLLVRSGPRRAGRALGRLWAPLASRRWLAWWLLGLSGQTLVLNYFQLSLLDAARSGGGGGSDGDGGGGDGGDDGGDGGRSVPFGLLEASIELGMLLGSLGAAGAARAAAARPALFLAATSAARALALVLAALSATRRATASAFALNVLRRCRCPRDELPTKRCVTVRVTGRPSFRPQ